MITIVSSSICPYCQMAKQLMDDLHIPYEEKSVEIWSEEMNEVVQTTWMMTVPQIFNWDISKENLLWGYSEVSKLHSEWRLLNIINNK